MSTEKHLAAFMSRKELSEIPSMIEWRSQQAVGAYNNKIEEAIKRRCEEYGYAYSPNRIVSIMDRCRNDLYYYKTDTGRLEPLIAISAMEMKWTDGEDKVTVTMESRELPPDIFRPLPDVQDQAF